jgi:hypothetical protein
MMMLVNSNDFRDFKDVVRCRSNGLWTDLPSTGPDWQLRYKARVEIFEPIIMTELL